MFHTPNRHLTNTLQNPPDTLQICSRNLPDTLQTQSRYPSNTLQTNSRQPHETCQRGYPVNILMMYERRFPFLSVVVARPFSPASTTESKRKHRSCIFKMLTGYPLSTIWRHLQNTFLTPSRHLPDTLWTPSRHLSDTFLTPSRHPLNPLTMPQACYTHSLICLCFR